MNSLYWTSVPYYQVFFDQNCKLITCIHENDANYRDEYFSPLFEHFGIKVKYFTMPDEILSKIETVLSNEPDVEFVITKYVLPVLAHFVKGHESH